MRRREDDYDEDEDDAPRRRGVRSRTYYHPRCGGKTQVSGGDFSHICDPYRVCTGTYCCTCAGFVPLSEVEWDDTGETITKYRRRMRRETPGPLAAWQVGLGAAAGAILCGGLALAVFLLMPKGDGKTMATTCILVALGGAAVFHFVGAAILKAVYRIDYRRVE